MNPPQTPSERYAIYADKHPSAANERQELVRRRRELCQSYWMAVTCYGNEIKALISGASENMIEEERVKYLAKYNATR